MRTFVKQAISYDSAARNLKSWSDCGLINMTYDEINEKRKSNPKQLLAIYWSYIRKWRDDKLGKKAKSKAFAALPSIEVAASTCQHDDCPHPVLAYDYCIQHFQKFINAQYPEATREEIQAYLRTLQSRAFTSYGVIVEPVKPVTPPGSQTPQSMEAPSEPHPNQENTTEDKSKTKKQPAKKEKKTLPTEQKQQVEDLTQQVVDKLENAFSGLKGFSKQGHGAPLKYRKRVHKWKHKQKEEAEAEGPVDASETHFLTYDDLRGIARDYGYERPVCVNFPGAGGQSYFTPHVAVLQAEKLLKKQAQIWAQDGMPEKEIKKRLQPFTDRVQKFKKRKPVTTPFPIEQSPEKNPQLLTPKM